MSEERDWLLILGSPGCGKTSRLIKETRSVIRGGVEPSRVGFLTFTRQAASVAMRRIGEPDEDGDGAALEEKDVPYFRTIHSLCMRQCGISSGQVLEGNRMQGFAEWLGVRIEGRVSQDGNWSGYEKGDRFLFMDGLARIRRVPLRQLYEEDHDDLDWLEVERFSRGLREYKTRHDMHDFTDMLEMFVTGRARVPNLEVLVVDEAQDLSLLQWDVIRMLAGGAREVFIGGDDDQAIFEWAGADVETMLTLVSRTEVLPQSYRVPRRVQALASGVIGRVSDRRPKTWRARDDEGVVRRVGDVGDVPLDGDSTMILARNRHMLAGVEADVRAAGILYTREGVPSVPQAVVQAIVVWERLRRGEPQRTEDVVRGPYELMSTGGRVKRGYKKLGHFHRDDRVTLDQLKEHGGLLTDAVWYEALDRMSVEDRVYLQRCRRRGELLTKPPRVRLGTIHGAKGGEADRVALLTDMAPRTWRESHERPDAENRALYVGLTRARQELFLVSPRTSMHYEV